ncbi:MAG TPA: tRNA epoxyqueuosine(34) reductase QueG [Acidimicrobiales bacterium]|nr:tRNA epoxyqueuosine(34) reductase QueG [Acidimicrobiales bacterium]
MQDLTQRVLDAGKGAGLVAVGVASAEPFDSTRRDLLERRSAGLSAGMQFTYRNPQRSTDASRALPGARALVAGAYPVCGVVASPAAQPTAHGRVARYVWRDHYAELRDALGVVAATLRDAGFAARVLADDNALVDRAVAVRAGLGWWGKNANVLVPGHGSWVVLGCVVTDAPLVPSDDRPEDGCGSCSRCIDGCPTGAIVAPGVVDARRCLAWLVQAPGTFPVEFRQALGDRIYGCDDCQEVCPPSRRVKHAETEPVSVDLTRIVASSDDEILRVHGKWYIGERDPRHVKRNALIALGNVGDDSVVPLLSEVARADDELLAEHARWALAQLA